MPTEVQVTRARDLRYQRTYGISLADYDALLAAQDGRCWICGRRPRTQRLVVDHDHRKRGRSSVRGLLCGSRPDSCNRLLGSVQDSQARLLRMAEYLATAPAQEILAQLD